MQMIFLKMGTLSIEQKRLLNLHPFYIMYGIALAEYSRHATYGLNRWETACPLYSGRRTTAEKENSGFDHKNRR